MLLSLIKCILCPDQPWCSPSEHFIVFCPLPCQPGKAADTVYLGLQRAYVSPLRFSHSSEGLRGELLCYFSQVLSQMVFDGRPEGLSKTAGAGWRQQCHMPKGVGGGGGKQFSLREPSDWLFPGSDSKKPPVQGTSKHPWLEWKGRSDRRKTRFGGYNRSYKPLDRSVSGPGLPVKPVKWPIIFKDFFILIFKEKRGEREMERNIDVRGQHWLAGSCMPPTRDGTSSLGMCLTKNWTGNLRCTRGCPANWTIPDRAQVTNFCNGRTFS